MNAIATTHASALVHTSALVPTSALGGDLLQAATAVAIGLMIGLQREFSYRQQRAEGATTVDSAHDSAHGAERARSGDTELFAGTRTFAVISLIGWVCAELAQRLHDPTPMWLGMLVMGAMLVAAYVLSRGEHGMTTEMAALLTFLLGVLCHDTPPTLPIALAVTLSVLLAIKLYTRSLVAALAPDDVFASLKFAVMTAIVLPVLPQVPVLPPPFDVWVPRDIWLMAVLIAAIGFAGYLLHKWFGARQGTALAGLLGGLVSSTAATLSFARASVSSATPPQLLGGAVLLAWTMMFLRVAVEVLIVHLPLLATLWPVLLLPVLASLPFVWRGLRVQDASDPQHQSTPSNPLELVPALGFAAGYAAIQLLADITFRHAGTTGLYAASFASGLLEVDAITLSLTRHAGAAISALDPEVATRGIALALVANTLVKAALVAFIARPRMRALVLQATAAIIVAAALGAAIAAAL